MLSPGGKKISGRVREKWSGGLKARLIDDKLGDRMLFVLWTTGVFTQNPVRCGRKRPTEQQTDRQTTESFMSGREEVMVGSLGSVKVSPDPSSLKGCLDVVVVVVVVVAGG